MLSKTTYILMSATLFLSVAAFAQQAQPSPEQMQAVRACAAKQGIVLPPPPGAQNDAPSSLAPQLTDEQKKDIDACFRASGLEPPAHHDDPTDNGEGKLPDDRLGPPPAADFR